MIRTSLQIRDREVHARFSRRLQWLTLSLGLCGAIAGAIFWSGAMGLAIAIGAVLAWLNYRWLDQGLGALVTAATAQEGSQQPRVPWFVYGKFAGRYVLIGLAVYVSVHFFAVPLIGVIIGLLALGAGAMVEGLYEVFSGTE
jgi:hypothetical protein